MYVLLAAAWAWPALRSFTSAIPSPRGLFDPPLQAYLLGWDLHALALAPGAIFDAPIFHPERGTLAYMDHLIGEAVLGWPVLATTGSIAAVYNALILLSTALSAWATYRLVRLFGVPRIGAFLCGSLFAFSSYRASSLDLLNQLQTQFLPLALFFAVRWLQRRTWRDAAGTLATFVVQVYFGWYYTVYLALTLSLLVVYAWFAGWIRPKWNDIVRAGALLACMAVAILPVTWPYVSLRLSGSEFGRSIGEAALYSADVTDYVRWSDGSVLAAALHLPSGAQGYWPGLATILLGAAGFWSLRRPSDHGQQSVAHSSARERMRRSAGRLGMAGYFLVLGIAAFVLSLGPLLHVAGTTLPIPLPYAAAHYVIPGVSGMRAPARLAVVVSLAMVVLGGFGYRAWSRAASSGKMRAIATVLFVIVSAEAWMEPSRLLPLPTRDSAPPEVQWLAAQPGDSPVLDLPAPRTESEENEADALRQYMQLIHGKRRIDGCSGYVSRRYRDLRIRLAAFPSPDVLDSLNEIGARYIVVHEDDDPDVDVAALRARIRMEPRLSPRAEWTGTAVYELDPESGEALP
jgi:hypothetical protein